MIDRRQLLLGGALTALLYPSVSVLAAEEGQPKFNLRDVARARGIEVGATAHLAQLRRPEFIEAMAQNVTLLTTQFKEMEWRGNAEPSASYSSLREYLDIAQSHGLRVRARQIYSHETLPARAHLRDDGTPKNKAELEVTLLTHVREACAPLRGRNAIIQVADEVLAAHEGGIREDPFTKVFGEGLIDMLFHAAHEAAPDAHLIYYDWGPEADPNHFFKRKTSDLLALLERLRKRNVPIAGLGLVGWVNPSGHFGGLDLQKSVFAAIENLEYDIHLTELTVIYQYWHDPAHWYPSDAATNDRVVEQQYTKVAEFLCRFKRLKEITFWAPVDGDNTVETGTLWLKPYKDARPGIFNRDLTPKPVYHSFARAVANTKPTI